MDSLVLGYAIYRLGLPPVIYGAGLNFSNLLVGFMHNLGAYTVDGESATHFIRECWKNTRP